MKADTATSVALRPAIWIGLVVTLLTGSPDSTRAQSPGEPGRVERARHLVEKGAYARASGVLREYLETHPDRPRVRWLLARTLYWQERFEAAEREYGRALEALPEEMALRVDYGRLLVETGQEERARDVLEPVLRRTGEGGRSAAETDALVLLGKLAYWSGDVGTARQRLTEALRAAPNRPEARRILTDVQRTTAPWLALDAEYRDDSQPLLNRSLGLEAGVPLTPRVAVSLRAVPRQLAGGAGEWRGVRSGTGALRVNWPGPLETRVEVGRLRHVAAGSGGWIGEGRLVAHLGEGFALRGTAERWNYRYTAGVLDTALFVESASGVLRRERPAGWGGEVGGRVQRFPDGNRIRSGHLWMLAPVWSESGNAVRLGYAFRAADSDVSTFRSSSSATGAYLSHRPGPHFGGGADGGSGIAAEGTYRPYYTPEDVRSHSAVAAFQVQASEDVTLSADGAVGVHATEQVPAAGSTGSATSWVERNYRPWRLRGRLGVEPTRGTDLRLQAGYREDAYFRVFEASVRWTYRFLGPLPGG